MNATTTRRHRKHAIPRTGPRIYCCPACRQAFKFVDLVDGPITPKHGDPKCPGTGMILTLRRIEGERS